MQNIARMQGSKCLDHLEKDPPDDSFFHFAARLLVLDNLLVEVSIVEKVHHDAQTGSWILKKCFFVTDDAAVTKINLPN